MKLLSWSLLSLTLVACTGVAGEEDELQGDEAALQAFPGRQFVRTTSCGLDEPDHAAEPEKVGDESGPQLIEFGRTADYGSLDDNKATRCTTWGDPDRCMVPDDKTLKFKVNVTTPTGLGLSKDLLRGAFAFAIAQTAPQINWTLTITGTQATESANTLVTASAMQEICGSSKAIGCAAQTLDKKFTNMGLPYWKTKRCSIYVNPNNVKWSTNATEQLWQAFNIYKHEIGHCLGLGHSKRGLMASSGAGETKTALAFDAADIANINSYAP